MAADTRSIPSTNIMKYAKPKTITQERIISAVQTQGQYLKGYYLYQDVLPPVAPLTHTITAYEADE